MSAPHCLRACLLSGSLALVLQPLQGFAQSKPDASTTDLRRTLEDRDGQNDFDFEIGTWKTHVRRLQRPLTGSTTWVEYEGTTVVRKLLGGRANVAELVVDGPAAASKV